MFLLLHDIFLHLFHKILVGMASSVDTDQTVPSEMVRSEFSLFAYATLSEEFLRKVGLQNFRTITELCNVQA